VKNTVTNVIGITWVGGKYPPKIFFKPNRRKVCMYIMDRLKPIFPLFLT